MKRKAILIGVTDVHPKLPGVDVDLNDISEFLESPVGGAWRKDEIQILRNPTRQTVISALSGLQGVDYVFITCSAHGEHRFNSQLSETVIILPNNESISVSEINPKNKRHTVIADVCRQLVAIPTKKVLKSLSENLYASLDSLTTVNFRQVFDENVLHAAEGRIEIYSCDINQTAGDPGTGGVFTQALLESVQSIHNKNYRGYTIVSLEQAFLIAQKDTQRNNSPQSPVMNAGRRQIFFPFAVVV